MRGRVRQKRQVHMFAPIGEVGEELSRTPSRQSSRAVAAGTREAGLELEDEQEVEEDVRRAEVVDGTGQALTTAATGADEAADHRDEDEGALGKAETGLRSSW